LASLPHPQLMYASVSIAFASLFRVLVHNTMVPAQGISTMYQLPSVMSKVISEEGFGAVERQRLKTFFHL
jgi:hypothetical protein